MKYKEYVLLPCKRRSCSMIEDLLRTSNATVHLSSRFAFQLLSALHRLLIDERLLFVLLPCRYSNGVSALRELLLVASSACYTPKLCQPNHAGTTRQSSMHQAQEIIAADLTLLKV